MTTDLQNAIEYLVHLERTVAKYARLGTAEVSPRNARSLREARANVRALGGDFTVSE